MNSLKQLSTSLYSFFLKNQFKTIQNCTSILNQYQGNDWKNHIEFKSKKYLKHIIYRDEILNYEIILICWDKYSQSSIHLHPKYGCVMKVLQGNLLEKRYDSKHILLSKHIIKSNSKTSYIHDDIGCHQIISQEDTVSLHVYSPCNFYE